MGSGSKDDSARSLFHELATELKKTLIRSETSSKHSSYRQVPCDETTPLKQDEEYEIKESHQVSEMKSFAKLDKSGSLNSAGKGKDRKHHQAFDLVAQMKGIFSGCDDSSIDSARFKFLERKTV